MAAPIADPFLLEQYFQTKPNPRVGLNPARNFGVDALQPGTVDAAIQGQAPAQYSQFGLPTIRRPQAPAPSRRTVFDPPAPSRTSFNPATGEFAVDGRRFAADDDAAFIEADKLLSGEGPPTGPQMPEGFLPISPINIQGRAANIRNAGFGTRVAKGFEGGIEQAKLLGGAALEAFGAQETGRAIVEDATKELAKLAPYSGEFTDIDSAGDALNWTAYMIGELGPGIIQTAAAALIGGGAGAVGALALRKSGGKLLKQAAKKQRAGEALNAAETKALTNSAKILAATRGKVASTAARRGALAGAGLEAYGSGVGEVAAEIIGDRGDQGPMSAEDRLTAILGGIPVAAVDFLPEYGIFETLFRGTRLAPTAASRAGAGTFPGASLLRRVGGAAAVGGAVEGLAEAGQEILIGALAGTEKTASDYINALAAGALGGSIISGSAGLLSRLKALDPNGGTVDVVESERQSEQSEQPEQLELFPDDPPRPGVSFSGEGVLQGELFDEEAAPTPDVAVDYSRQLDLFDTPEPAPAPAPVPAGEQRLRQGDLFAQAEQQDRFDEVFRRPTKAERKSRNTFNYRDARDAENLRLDEARRDLDDELREELRLASEEEGLAQLQAENAQRDAALIFSRTRGSVRRTDLPRAPRQADSPDTGPEPGPTPDPGPTPEPEPEPGPTPEPGFEFAEDVSPNVATDYVLPYLGKGGKEATMTDTPQNMTRRTVDWIRAVRNAKEKLKTC